MKLTELNELLPDGYTVEELDSSEQVAIKMMLLLLNEIEIDSLQYDTNKIIDSMKREAAEEAVDEIRNRVLKNILSAVIAFLDEKIV